MVASLKEGEWSSYRGGQCNRRGNGYVKEVVTLMENGHATEVVTVT